MSGGPKFPDVKVKLVGEDGNAFAVIGRCMSAARRAGVPESDRAAFIAEATSGDYSHLLTTCMEWWSCDEGEDEDDES